MLSTPAAMVTVYAWVAVKIGEEESSTFTVNVEDPAVVGVPESLPSVLKLKPAGNVPDATLQE